MRRLRTGSAFALMTLSITSVSCFDVHGVDPGPPVLDDFEDGDFTPSLRPFTDWSCQTVEPPDPPGPPDCVPTDGYDSSHGLAAAFAVSDPLDGIQQHGGVIIMTNADRPIDLTGLSHITFEVRLTNSTTTAFPSKSLLHLDLLCSTVMGESGASLVDAALMQSVGFDLAGGWTPANLAIKNFGPPPWIADRIVGGPPACLRAVDGIQLVFDAAIPDGMSGAGTLSIDDIVLR